MSGIVGIVNLDGAPVDRELLSQMTDFLSFRGPDAQEVWVEDNVGFGHAMLRTTWEAKTERQPLTLDGKIWLTADARIDGRAELIAELEAKLRRKIEPVELHGQASRLTDDSYHSNGYDSVARTPNDAELILFAYEAWGEDCVKHLIGDFAFAIWDSHQRRLFCARDHFGIKPFFYAHVDNTFVFSNTLNCVRLHPKVSDELNEIAIGDYLLFGDNYERDTTAFVQIARLPGAHTLISSSSNFKVQRYWSLTTDFHLHYQDSQDYPEQFRSLLTKAVKDRLRTSRVAFEMSGGGDSTSVAALATTLTPNKAGALKAFCVSYENLIPDQERQYSGLAASALGIPIEHIIADEFQLFDKRSKPEPFDIYPLCTIPTALITQISKHARVMLTGWDGDLWISETPRHYFSYLLKSGQLGSLAAAMGHYMISQRRLPPIGARAALRRWKRKPDGRPYPVWIKPEFERRAGLRERWKQFTSEKPLAHPTRPSAIVSYSGTIWTTVLEGYDPGVTGIPVQARHPLFDIRVVEFLLRLPPVPWCANKEIIRSALRGILPSDILRRPKSPLAANPEVKMIEKSVPKEIESFAQRIELGNYVNNDEIPSITAETDTWKLWVNLRPFGLNEWLSQPAPRSAVSEANLTANRAP